MDADLLRSILDAQAVQQQKALNAVVDRMERMFAAVTGSPTAAPATTTEFITNSLSTRLPVFCYDPDSGCTFDVWYSRYEDIISKDGSTLDDAAKVRLIVSKLDAAAYARFTNHIRPYKTSDIPLEDTVKTLKQLFGHNASVFSRRYSYLRTQRNGESLLDYTGTVNLRHDIAEFNDVTPEQMKCLVWICGLVAPEDADIRARALRKMEDNPMTTLKELNAEIQQFVNIRHDVKLLEGQPSPLLHAVNSVVKNDSKRDIPHSRTTRDPPSPCFRCGGHHWAKDCQFINKPCHECKLVGHKRGFCKNFTKRKRTTPKKKPKTANTVIVASNSSQRNNSALLTHGSRIYRNVQINGTTIRMRFDTGADVTLLSRQDWIKVGSPKLLPPLVSLKAANRGAINVHGQFKCKFVIDGHQGQGNCHVADTASLLGLDWISQNEPLLHRLAEGGINNVSAVTLRKHRLSLANHLQKQFPTVFTTELGRCTKSKATLVLKSNAKPVFRKARPVPYAALPRLSLEIDRLVAANVLSPVDHAEWAAPVVAVQKKNGCIRLCADFSTGLNDALEQHQYPLPTPEDIFTKLNGGRYFSQLDLAEAYLQLEVEENSKQLLTINTHRGLFVFNRLPFGVKPAPAIFQQLMDSLTAGLEGTAAYLDDIVITGRTIDEHNSRVEAVFRRINEYGLRVRMEKCSFLETEIKYLGFIISAEGRRPDPVKIEAIRKMPAPTDVSQLRAFLGLVNFYGTFVKELYSLRAPLDALTKKDVKYAWTTPCQAAFDAIKDKLRSDLLLTHYDPNLPIILAADASNYGIGAVLSHRFENGSEKAIYHASRALTPAQKRYSQIEKEALAIIFAVQKFHRFIHGRHFTLKTDHKPLLSIFGSKKGIPVYSANRLQRWAIILSNYNFTIEYINTRDFGQADALSRLISSQTSEAGDEVIALVDAELTAEVVEMCSRLPVSHNTIRTATAADKLLNQVIDRTLSGKWPKVDSNSPFWPFFNRRDTLSTVNGCLLTSNRIVIPKALQSRVLGSLHKGHPGQTRMKMLARSYVYWPSLNDDIDKLVKACTSCARAAKDPVKAELCSWPKPTTPWTRVHADFAGPLDGVHYLVIVDAYSKWPEIIQMKSVTTSTTISALKKVFAQFGNPSTLVTDNGTQFTASLFKDFCTSRGIKHVRSPQFHPQSNGQAERFVDRFKRAIIKLKDEEGTMADIIQTFLMAYRSTPCPSGPNHLSPAENFLGRKIRTELDLMKPPTDDIGTRDAAMEEQFKRQHGARHRKFRTSDTVYVKDYRNMKPTWVPGVILQRRGNTIYSVQVGDMVWIRHANQIRPRSSVEATNKLLDVFDMQLFNNSDHIDDATPPMPKTPRRSTRTRRAPHRLEVDPAKRRYDLN